MGVLVRIRRYSATLLLMVAITGVSAACAPGQAPTGEPTPAPTQSDSGSCQAADAALSSGLVSAAEAQYKALLPQAEQKEAGESEALLNGTSSAAAPSPAAPSPLPMPSLTAAPSRVAAPSPGAATAAIPACAIRGLTQVRLRRAQAAGAVAAGDRALANGQRGDAREWYEWALKYDVDSADAAAGLVKVEQSGTVNSAASDRWRDVLGRWSLPFLGVLLAIFLLARVRLAFVGRDDKKRRPNRWEVWWAVAAGVGGAALFTVVWAGFVAGVGAVLVFLAALGLAVLSAGVLAVAWGRRLGVRVAVEDGDTKVGDNAYLIGRLAEIGSQHPQGILLPNGSDVVSLPTEALTELPQGRFVQSLLKIVFAILPGSPWQATVVLGSDDSATVTMTRNLRAVDTKLIHCDDVVSESEGDDRRHYLLTAAASAIFLTLCEYHGDEKRGDLRKGLCGTTQWRSLAKQVLAVEPPFVRSPRGRARMYGEAVEVDPGNRMAWYGFLLWQPYANPASPERAREVAVRMDALYGSLTKDDRDDVGYTALCIRMLYSSATGWLNYSAYPTTEEAARKNARWHAAVSADAMYAAAEKLEKQELDRLHPFAHNTKGMAQRLVKAVETVNRQGKKLPWLESDDEHYAEFMGKSLTALYVVACDATRNNQKDRAMAALTLGVGRELQRLGAQTDPALAKLSGDPRFVRLLTGQGSVAHLPDMHGHAQTLDNHGIFVVGDLLARPAVMDVALARDLGLSEESMKQLRSHAEFAATCPEPHSSAGWVTMLNALDVNDIDALRKKTEDPAILRRLQQTLSALAVAGHVSAPTEEQLTKWAAGKPKANPEATGPADRKDAEKDARK